MEQLLDYLKLVPNYKPYHSLRWLILLPVLFFVVFSYLVFWTLPKNQSNLGRILMVIIGSKRLNIVVGMYLVMSLMTKIVMQYFGSTAQLRRYANRQKEISKILQYFNRNYFSSKGVHFECSKYAAYIVVHLD